MLLGWSVVIGLGGLLVYSIWTRGQWRWRELVPRQRFRAVPWGFLGVLVSFLFYYSSVVFADAVFLGSGWYEYLYGPEFLEDESSTALTRRFMWPTVAAFPLQVFFILHFLYLLFDVRPYQLGITGYRAGRYVVLGYISWLVATPIVFLVQILAYLVCIELLDLPEQMHELEQLGKMTLSPVEWIMLFLVAVVVAPIWEELFFRGLVQGWLLNRWWGGDVALAAAYLVAILLRLPDFPDGAPGLYSGVAHGDWNVIFSELQPAFFVLVMLVIYAFLRNVWQSVEFRTIYGVALLFAVCHCRAWPSPIPLFFLAVVLGYLAYRTQSLVAPITVHALFNAIAFLTLLFYTWLGGPENGKEETTALRRPPAASSSSSVPGSW